MAERLRLFPLRHTPVAAPVEIRWNEHLVPFIEAKSDRDLAVALGLVHAHLRLAQMELLRRIAQGRLAEVLGARALPFDRALHAIDIGRAVPAIIERLPDETRDWLDGFVAGINHHIATVEAPVEFRLLGIRVAHWTISDIVSIVRLAAVDAMWMLWSALLPLRHRPDWPGTWSRLLAEGTIAMAGTAEERRNTDIRGSNALAVAASRSATGGSWLAGDAHLPLTLPSVWLAAGYRSPSYNLAGLMFPGLPAMFIGRNPYLAWGGTNLLAASSELFDVSGLPSQAIRNRRVRIAVRWSRPREIVLRETPCGPIVSDLPFFPARPGEVLALRWVGHQPSDEITALLAINRARDASSFRAAAEGIAVPGQNLLYATTSGRIGRVSAAWLPCRNRDPPADLVSPPAAAAAWAELATMADFPEQRDPADGFIVSANDRPPIRDVPIGWLFAPPERAERLAMLLGSRARIGLADLAALQTNVAAASAARLRDRLCAILMPPPEKCPVFAALAGWDGRYETGSAGALAFELVAARLIERLVPQSARAMLGAVRHGIELVAEQVDDVPPDRVAAALRAALAESRPEFRRLGDWGGAHRLHLAHPLARIPWIGRSWRGIDWAWPGSNETLLKAAHPPVNGRHATRFGSNARYVFDLSDPDANRVVILGGQDGAPGSAAFLDQAELFRRGAYIEVPLNPETARARFRHVTVARP
ncbi:MAG TPA: penicillin acylase family protein [Stellaceae bacterium]|nr:penicillin acylase family protein [Stellaceae bacterium]